ncbi:hypothetical protein [Pelagibius sp. Alg239-R121]|uniref:hypothetical protein n=1 Tax=Pelagibius sp. Alg239-R121 TaxID=2993448 RepID=UPI0024A655FA|nr:hypothetical protein [Pelagibius sp. Alg239-R121]
MAAFACIADLPILLSDGPTIALLLPPVFAGGSFGWVLQADAVGRKSNSLIAAACGAFCALLSLPIVMLGSILIAISNPIPHGIFDLIAMLVMICLAAIALMWWWIFPIGAVAGLTLHLIWKQVEKRQEELSEQQLNSCL